MPNPEAPTATTTTLARTWFHLGPLAVTPRRLGTALVAILAAGLVAAFWHRIDLAALHARAQAMPAMVVVAAVSVLPLVGFPVSWLHLIAGVRFGFVGGLGTVAATTLIQHWLGWLIVRFAPARWFDRLGPWRERLAGAGQRDATLLCCLLPGMPYSVQLYLLPVLGVRLGLLLGLSTALHTGRALVTILLGDLSDHLTPLRLTGLVFYYAVLVVASVGALRLLRRKLTPPA